VLPIPLQARGHVELHLVFVSGDQVVVSGEAIELELMGEARYLDEVDGGNEDLS